MQGNYFSTSQNVGYIDGQEIRDHNAWRREMQNRGYPVIEVPGGSSQGTGYESVVSGSGGAPPAFKFDWEAAEKTAFEKLKPYYEKLLADAGGDINVAKQRLDEDRTRERRIAQEDFGQEMGAFNVEAPIERRNALAEANQRGILLGQMEPGQQSAKAPYSPYAQETVINPMDTKQQLRKQAIERALARQEEVADVTKNRGFQDLDTKFRDYKKAIEQERSQRGTYDMPQLDYQKAYTRYQSALG